MGLFNYNPTAHLQTLHCCIHASQIHSSLAAMQLVTSWIQNSAQSALILACHAGCDSRGHVRTVFCFLEGKSCIFREAHYSSCSKNYTSSSFCIRHYRDWRYPGARTRIWSCCTSTISKVGSSDVQRRNAETTRAGKNCTKRNSAGFSHLHCLLWYIQTLTISCSLWLGSRESSTNWGVSIVQCAVHKSSKSQICISILMAVCHLWTCQRNEVQIMRMTWKLHRWKPSTWYPSAPRSQQWVRRSYS